MWIATILTVSDDLARALNDKLQVDESILDLLIAFDKVPHRRFLSKIEYYGITEKVLKWLESFLTNYSQQVIASNSMDPPKVAHAPKTAAHKAILRKEKHVHGIVLTLPNSI